MAASKVDRFTQVSSAARLTRAPGVFFVTDSRTRGRQNAFFLSQDENENFSYSISHIETRRKFLNLRLRDKTEKNFLQSQALRLDRDSLSSISETRTRIEMKTILARILEIPFCCLD